MAPDFLFPEILKFLKLWKVGKWDIEKMIENQKENREYDQENTSTDEIKIIIKNKKLTLSTIG